jgi:uncharacterized protein (UPF0335 family)
MARRATADDLLGHNSGLTKIDETTREKLRQTVTKIERLEEEKKEVADQIKEVYAEAKAIGFDTKALRTAIKLRKIERSEREEQEMILETYLIALGEA